MTQRQKLVIGCGYLGSRVAKIWQDDGDQVHVTTRSTDRAVELAAAGFTPHVMDVARGPLPALPPVETILYCVGYDRQSGDTRETVYQQGVRNVLSAMTAADQFIYISSTGVYGQAEGQWVDEDSVCRPQSDGGINCLAAESILRDSDVADRLAVLRLAGIYGPGRLPLERLLREGRALPVAADGYLNLIHVEDAVQSVQAVSAAALPVLYVVSDGQPVLRRDYYGEMAKLIGVEPEFQQPASGTSRAERSASSKRVRSQRIVQELDLRWRYPDFRRGLSAILKNSTDPQ